MRWNVTRPSLTAATMPASPGSVSTMPAADLATSVAVETAIPICAWRSAGASLAPSPHMPTVWPPFWNALTSLYLSSGKTPAKTANSSGRTPSGIGPGGQIGAIETDRLRDDGCRRRRIARHHDGARRPRLCNSVMSAAESVARRIAERDRCPRASSPSAGPAATASTRKPLSSSSLAVVRRGRRRLGEADDGGKGALHDPLACCRSHPLRVASDIFVAGSKGTNLTSFGASETRLACRRRREWRHRPDPARHPSWRARPAPERAPRRIPASGGRS